MRRGKFPVTSFQNPSGKIAYRVSGTLNGKRIRNNYDSREKALMMANKFELEHFSHKNSLQIRSTRLTQQQLEDAEVAQKKLPTGTTFDEAVTFFAARYESASAPTKIKDAYDLFLADKQAEKLACDSIKSLKNHLGQFVRKSPDTMIDAVKHAAIQDYIDAAIADATKSNRRRALVNFFHWAQRKRLRVDDPTFGIRKTKIPRGKVVFFSVEQCSALLKAASQPPIPRSGIKPGGPAPTLRAYVALGIFAGLRPSELTTFKWTDVNWTENKIKVEDEHDVRYIPMPRLLRDWLFPVRHEPVVPKNFRRIFTRVKKSAGITEWVPDVMRHTAISHWVALPMNGVESAAKFFGNSEGIIRRHYLQTVEEATAGQFWHLHPNEVLGLKT